MALGTGSPGAEDFRFNPSHFSSWAVSEMYLRIWNLIHWVRGLSWCIFCWWSQTTAEFRKAEVWEGQKLVNIAGRSLQTFESDYWQHWLGAFEFAMRTALSSLMLLHLAFPLIPLEITFFLEIKHLQIKRLLVKLESWTFFIKLSRSAYQRARYCTYIVIWCMRVLLLYVDMYVHIYIIYKVFIYMLWFSRTAHTDTPPPPHTHLFLGLAL